jgi:hypothetical protein
MRVYIDDETALKLNPYIMQEQVSEILERVAAEKLNRTNLDGLSKTLEDLKGGAGDGLGT